jgi:hypothetical protein
MYICVYILTVMTHVLVKLCIQIEKYLIFFAFPRKFSGVSVFNLWSYKRTKYAEFAECPTLTNVTLVLPRGKWTDEKFTNSQR